MGGSGPNVMRLDLRRHGRDADKSRRDDDDRLRDDDRSRDVVGFGGKSGVYTLLDAKAGRFLWNTFDWPRR